MLDKQYFLYSVDTGNFYSSREQYLHNMNCRYHSEQNCLQEKLPQLEKMLLKAGCSDRDLKNLRNGRRESVSAKESAHPLIDEYCRLLRLIQHKKTKAKEAKEKLLALLANKTAQNELTAGSDHIRALRESSLNDTNVISVFDSALSRMIGIQQDELSDALIIVQVYYFDIFKDISFYGFTYKGETYRYFTSSAGQIRKKKAVFIKQSVWDRIEKTVMCGLTIDKINAKGGNNVNKHLAYMALTNSATDEWDTFDIDRSIVIDDFETNVYGTFDFVDETDYSVTRKRDHVPIPHTDGAGMILPALSSKNFMVRAPWIKGLLGVFDFRKFIEVNHCSPVITDIYGQSHHIIDEDIQIIFTKSQFKMYRYYDSWEEYKKYFRQYHCHAGKCNIEENKIKNAKINYQMLQTLTDITEEEIDLLTHRSAERIRNICSSKETMMDILGITPYNTHMTPFQKAVRLYPALLNDAYTKDMLREIKNSLIKKYRSGKLEINGKYTFLLPDFYAACEYWFAHSRNPKGLLNDKEVFCRLFCKYDKLDCLRSPHLYKEHAVRYNIAHTGCKERAARLAEWFCTDGVYTSAHDLISKILQFDVDGDKALLVADKAFIQIAERNMRGIVPLYYNMRKSEAVELNRHTIYEGLIKAFTSGNIGRYSNNIAKIWNHNVFLNGSKQEKQEAVHVIKLLCMENNFCIDVAKTLYMPERPEWFSPVVSKYTSCPLPAFFAYAKDKTDDRLQQRNASLVNRIYDKIPDKPINTRGLRLGRPDHKAMMSDPAVQCSKEVSDLYDKLSRQYRHIVNLKDESQDNLHYTACRIRAEFAALHYAEETIADMLTSYLYDNNKRYKQLLWFCYGQYLFNHLEQNLKAQKTNLFQCIDCGIWIETDAKGHNACRCSVCQREYRKTYQRKLMQKRRLLADE